jgi:hypothetical protein
MHTENPFRVAWYKSIAKNSTKLKTAMINLCILKYKNKLLLYNHHLSN